MKNGDLVKDAYSPILGLIVSTENEHFLINWIDPGEAMILKTKSSWRTTRDLELVNEAG
jgi:hypothetical protein